MENGIKIPSNKSRIGYIDFLKVIGLTGIIIAHVGSPAWLMMLRSFDVPFMVILSSILGERSYSKHTDLSNIQYCIRRFKRLVVPTWILLVIYFTLSFLLTKEFKDARYYLYSFCMTRYGIDYVWIIMIYLYSALLIPIFHRIKLSKLGIGSILLIYILYEVAYYFRIGTNIRIIDSTFYYIIPYGVLTYLGYNYSAIKRKDKKIITIAFLMIFIFMAKYYYRIYGSFQLVQIAKYPPRIYYLSYGIAISFILLLLCENKDLKIYGNPLIRYVSSHSMWIYLWHIVTIKTYELLGLPEIWYIKLVIVYLCAVILVYIVNKILDIIEKNRKFFILKYLRG